jgi:hypothetical protein
MDIDYDRFDRAAAAIVALRPRVEAGEPWPLSAAYGVEPESSWGPKEVLAHLVEMIPYWTRQVETIVAGGGGEPVPFGRVASDAARIERIGTDRAMPAGKLFDRFAAEVEAATGSLRAVPNEDGRRVGIHPRLGEMSAREIPDRFIISHLEEHAQQLGTLLGDASDANTGSGGRRPG